jgi:hypothetical protein
MGEERNLMPGLSRSLLIAGILALVVVLPALQFRYVYAHNKRLREVEPGKVYRSGQMTAEGFADAVKQLHLRTIINLQDDHPDPSLDRCFFGGGTIKESELCRQLGVRYIVIAPDLISRLKTPEQRPAAIDQFLQVLDDPDVYPVLWHCRAGLNRTGVMTAVYRMEYNGWSPGAAIEELKANGFGEWSSTSANDYISQYVLSFRRGIRCPMPASQNAASDSSPAKSISRHGITDSGSRQ